MRTSRLRKREKQLARAMRAMREVAQEIEAMAFSGVLVHQGADLLPLAARLHATRNDIVQDREDEAANGAAERAPAQIALS